MKRNTSIGFQLLGGLIATLFFTMPLQVQAQRLAFVDVNEILESIQEYQQAQTELDRIAQGWRQEVAQEYDKIKGAYNRYQAEQVLMSDEARKAKEEEIMEMERSVRDLQKQRFGPEGDLFQRRRDLVQPIQDRVYAAIESYANERGYDFIFDKGSTTGMLFASPRYDVTKDILDNLKK